jgi:hypothetical protein
MMSNWMKRITDFMSNAEDSNRQINDVIGDPVTVEESFDEENVDEFDEVLIALEDIREVMDDQSVTLSNVYSAVKGIASAIGTLVDVLRSDGSISGSSSADADDMVTVMTAQRKIIRAFLNTPELSSEIRKAVAIRLASMQDWGALEAAEKRLAERAKNRKSVEELTHSEDQENE